MNITNLVLAQINTPGGDPSTIPTEAGATGAEEGVIEVTYIDLIFGGGWGSIVIMIALGVLFVAAVFIFVERLIATNRASGMEAPFMAQIRSYVTSGDLNGAKNLCSSTDSPVARMIDKGIMRIGKPLDDIGVSIENAGKLEIYKLERNLSSLATIAGAAPMIGFLGTVTGMIITFREMAYSGNGVEIGAMAGGIMQAMVTTVGGLIVGIIAYIAYNYMVARVEKVIHRMEASTIDFLDLLQEPGK